MKNIFPKIKINSVTYFLFFTYLITGHFKNILLIFLIVLIHEFGHVFFLKVYSYKIESIEILPFGGVTKTTKFINTPIKHDLIIYFGGVFFQVMLSIFFIFLYSRSYIYTNTFLLFMKYNFSILIFNILPIRPLDGGEILKLLLEKFHSYAKAQKLANSISILFLVLFFIINIKFKLNNYVIISFLMVKLFELIRKEKFYKNKFLLERFLYDFSYRKINNESQSDLNLLKKDTYHFFKENKKYISEKELLQRKFDIQSYF